jgi:phosphoribosylanthranilate isomerase
MVLFDSVGPAPGGNGVTFRWELLENYPHDVPFMVAGGLNPTTVPGIKSLLSVPQFAGIDLNSGVEVSAGVKDPHLVSDVMKMVRHELRR